MVLPSIDDVLQYCATLGTVASWNRTQHAQIIRIRMKEAIHLPTQRRNNSELPVKVFHALRCACPAIRLSVVLHNLTAHLENVCRSAPPEVKQRERALERIRNNKKSSNVRTEKGDLMNSKSNDKVTQTLIPQQLGGGSGSGGPTQTQDGSKATVETIANEPLADSHHMDLLHTSSQKSTDHETVDLRAEVGLPRDEEIYFCQLLVSDTAPQVYKAHWTPTFCPMGVTGCDVSLERPVLRKRVFHSSLPPRFAVRRYVCHTHSGAFTALDPYMLTNLPDGVRLSRDVVVRGRSVATREFLSLLGVMWEDCGNVHTVRCNLMELWHRLLNECLGRLEVLTGQLRNAAPDNSSLVAALPNEVLLREETKHLTELTERTVHDLLQAWSEAPQSFTYSSSLPTDMAANNNGESGSDHIGHITSDMFMQPSGVVDVTRQPTTTTVMVTSSEDHHHHHHHGMDLD